MAIERVVPGLERSDFITPPSKTPQRIIYLIMGLTKSGKSTFPFYGPGPIAVLDTDRRLEGVVQKAMSGKLTGQPKEVVWMPIKMPQLDIRSRKEDSTVKRHAEEQLNKWIKNFKLALESSRKPGGVRTISIDTGTELIDLRKCAEFGRVMGIQPRDLGGVNQDMRDWMRMGEEYNANIVWVHHVKDEWGKYRKGDGSEDSAPTGRKILDGYNKAEQCVQVVLESQVKGDKFYVKVLSSGLTPATNGVVYSEKDWGEHGPFAHISAEQKPRTSPEDWLDEEEN